MRTCWIFRLCASPCWTRWGVGTKRNEILLNIQWQQNTNPKTGVRDDDSDTDSDNEMFMKSETNWLSVFIVESASKDLPLQK